MSSDNLGPGAPILPGSPLARALDDFAVPPLSAGFADRVLAAAETRSPPLPELRRPAGGRGWRMGRRIAVAALGFGALASAAAATGLLERFDIPVPSPEKVWASLTGKPQVAAPVVVATVPREAAPTALAPVVIDGPIDSPEELGEAFRRIDDVRQGRIEARRAVIDQRLDRAIERRRAAGLPVPTPEKEAQLRARIEAERLRREASAAERIAAQREELRQRVENGEALTRKDFVPRRDQDPAARERLQRLQRLRQLTPHARREELRQLPAEERRALIEEFRQRRVQRVAPQPAPTADAAAPVVPAPAATPATVETQPQP